MSLRSCTRAPAQHVLITHEFAFVYAERAGRGAKTSSRRVRRCAPILPKRPQTSSHQLLLVWCGVRSPRMKSFASTKLPFTYLRQRARSHSNSVGSRAPLQFANVMASKITDVRNRLGFATGRKPDKSKIPPRTVKCVLPSKAVLASRNLFVYRRPAELTARCSGARVVVVVSSSIGAMYSPFVIGRVAGENGKTSGDGAAPSLS